MRYVAAALLTVLAEKEVNAENIKMILSSVGVEAESDKLDLVVKALAGKDIAEIQAEGAKLLASMPSGGGAAPAAAAGGDAPAAAPAKPVEEEVDALEGGMDMFGGGGSDY